MHNLYINSEGTVIIIVKETSLKKTIHPEYTNSKFTSNIGGNIVRIATLTFILHIQEHNTWIVNTVVLSDENEPPLTHIVLKGFFLMLTILVLTKFNLTLIHTYWGVDKSLARLGRKQAAPVKSVMGRGMDWFGLGRDRWWTLMNEVMKLQVPQNAGNVACFPPDRAKYFSAPLYVVLTWSWAGIVRNRSRGLFQDMSAL